MDRASARGTSLTFGSFTIIMPSVPQHRQSSPSWSPSPRHCGHSSHCRSLEESEQGVAGQPASVAGFVSVVLFISGVGWVFSGGCQHLSVRLQFGLAPTGTAKRNWRPVANSCAFTIWAFHDIGSYMRRIDSSGDSSQAVTGRTRRLSRRRIGVCWVSHFGYCQRLMIGAAGHQRSSDKTQKILPGDGLQILPARRATSHHK